MQPIRLALVNDYEVVVQGLKSMLRRYSSQIEFVDLSVGESVDSHADIALYDSFANPETERHSAEALVHNPYVDKVVLYTWEADESAVAKALEHGVSGYISKTTPAKELVEALEAIHQGDTNSRHSTGQTGASYGDWPGREEGLTQREAEILALITQGISNEQIADHTHLSINTVKTYIRSAYRRIGVERRAEAVLWGVRNGFLPDRSHDESLLGH